MQEMSDLAILTFELAHHRALNWKLWYGGEDNR